jgi:mannose-1-phosphate guanylyltransferase
VKAPTKAMVLAAGLGTRLRPLTDDRPKALVEVAGRTLLEITLTRLRAFGIRDVIVNVHHFADRMIEYLAANANFGMNIVISREDVLLDTGGGLKQAAWFFAEGAMNDGANSHDEPFLLHNVDVISTIDLARMLDAHQYSNALATLAVQERESPRCLLFDRDQRLCGRRIGDQEEIARMSDQKQALAFCGIHVISPRMLSMIREEGIFSIINTYLDLAACGETIAAFRADEYYWRDLGKPEEIRQAADDFKTKRLAL